MPVEQPAASATFADLLRISAWRDLMLAQVLRQIGTFGMASLTAVLLWSRSPAAAGGAIAVFFASGIVSPWLVGLLSDKYGRHRLLAATGAVEVLLLAVLGGVLAAQGPVPAIMAVVAGLGLVDACNGPLFAPSVVEVVPEPLAVKSSSAMGFGYDGGKIAGAAVAAAGLVVAPWAAAAGAVLAALIALFLVNRSAPRALPGATGAALSMSQIRQAPWGLVAAPFLALVAMVFLAGQTTLVLSGLSLASAGTVMGLGAAAFAVGCILGTVLVVRQTTVLLRHFRNGLLCMAAVIGVAALCPPASLAAVAALTAYGVTIGYCWQVAWPLIVPPVPAQHRGAIAGGLQAGVQITQAAGAMCFALLAVAGTSVPFVAAAASAALIAAALLAAGRQASRRPQAAKEMSDPAGLL